MTDVQLCSTTLRQSVPTYQCPLLTRIPSILALTAAVAAYSELFPTVIRSAVLGYQNQAARVGGIIAPFIVMASAGGADGNLVPFLTFGAASVLASLLIFTLPETLGVPLPDTMEVCCCLNVSMYGLPGSKSVVAL
jgi:OCT family organic cation transporter-like MFS transporter 4/5